MHCNYGDPKEWGDDIFESLEEYAQQCHAWHFDDTVLKAREIAEKKDIEIYKEKG